MTNLLALCAKRQLSTSTQSTLARLCQGALMMMMGWGSLFMLSQRAIAAETVTLISETEELSISIDQLNTFAETGELSDEAQEFFNTSRQDAPTIRDAIATEIVIGSDIERFLETSTGEFVILQLDQLVSRSPNQETLDALRTALRSAYEDDGRFSILEIANAYPQDEIFIDLRGLQRVYTDVKTFVERIQPALDAARGYLQEILCDCEPAASPAPAESAEPESPDDPESAAESEQSSAAPVPTLGDRPTAPEVCPDSASRVNLNSDSTATLSPNTL